MTASELRSRSSEELAEEFRNLKDTLFHLRFRRTLGQLEDTAQFKRTRKDIARVRTMLRLRELGIERAP